MPCINVAVWHAKLITMPKYHFFSANRENGVSDEAATRCPRCARPPGARLRYLSMHTEFKWPRPLQKLQTSFLCPQPSFRWPVAPQPEHLPLIWAKYSSRVFPFGPTTTVLLPAPGQTTVTGGVTTEGAGVAPTTTGAVVRGVAGNGGNYSWSLK